jgi:hypothetical protein
MFKTYIVIFMLAAAAVSAKHAWEIENEREMNKIDRLQGNMKMTESHYARRRNQAPWRKLMIYFDNSALYSDRSSEDVAFYTKVFEIVGQWWGKALYVRDSRSAGVTQIARYAQSSEDYRYEMTDGKQMSDYDLFVKVSWGSDSGSTLAYAGPRIRHPTSQRPITGITCVTPYGHKYFNDSSDSINRAVGTIIHEFGHVIAFISLDKVQERYVDIDRNINAYIWKGPQVLVKANAYYGCTSLTGVPLQNLNGRVGGHWDEGNLFDELMTPMANSSPEKVSTMTLALCEDTEWYKADYSFAENYTYSKGKGCSVFNGCPQPAICEAGRQGFITHDKSGVGYCQENQQGCATESKFSNRNCASKGSWSGASDQFGASFGGDSAVAGGRFYRDMGGSYTGTTQSCTKVRCSGTSSYTFTFKNFRLSGRNYSGDVEVTCTSSGRKSFNAGGSIPESYVECETPREFCEAKFGGNATCHESCLANGRCQNNSGNLACWCYNDFRARSGSCPTP